MGGRKNVQSASPLSLQFDTLFRSLRKRDPALAQRILDILRRLNCLPNGATSKYAVDMTTGSSSTDSPPPTQLNAGDKQSLFHHYLHWFLEANSDETLLARVMEAEREHSAFKGQPDDAPHRGASAAEVFGDDGAAMEAAQAQRILSAYVGKKPDQVARLEGDKRLTPWIEKIRSQNHRDVETGQPLPAWKRWGEEIRRNEIRSLRRRNLNISQIAEHLSVSRTTIRKYWDQTNPNKEAA